MLIRDADAETVPKRRCLHPTHSGTVEHQTQLFTILPIPTTIFILNIHKFHYSLPQITILHLLSQPAPRAAPQPDPQPDPQAAPRAVPRAAPGDAPRAEPQEDSPQCEVCSTRDTPLSCKYTTLHYAAHDTATPSTLLFPRNSTTDGPAWPGPPEASVCRLPFFSPPFPSITALPFSPRVSICFGERGPLLVLQFR
jgi:hypothetical protein